MKPGETRNPKGSSKLARERAALKKHLSKEDLEAIGKMMLKGKLSQLEKIVEDSKANGTKKHGVMKVMWAGMALKAIKGDSKAFNAIIDRLYGKVPSDVNLSNPDGTMRPQVFVGLPDNGRGDSLPPDAEPDNLGPDEEEEDGDEDEPS